MFLSKLGAKEKLQGDKAVKEAVIQTRGSVNGFDKMLNDRDQKSKFALDLDKIGLVTVRE